jgi:esterase/lipase superfamily enzyme
MANKKDTQAITFRAPTEVVEQLDELCRIAGIKRSEFIIGCITSEHDKMNGNPKLKEIMEQFRAISEQMKQLTGQAPAGSGVTTVTGNGGEGEA